MDDDLLRFSRSFDSVAGAYDRGRPTYPTAAVEFLVGPEQKTVLEVGAGTGKLTEQLVALGHDVHATDPSSVLLGVLTDRLPGVRTSVARAEELPLLDASVDVLACAQAFHWFDQEAALAEFARVLRPGGHLALAWNTRDEKVPWVRKLGAIIGTQDSDIQVPDSLVRSDKYGFVEESSTGSGRWWTASRCVTWRCPAPTWPFSTPRPRRSCWPRFAASTTTTAGAPTACSCPGSPGASRPR